MRRILILLMAMSIIFMTGCGKKTEVDNNQENADTKTEAVDKKAPAKDEKPADTKAPAKDEKPADTKAPAKDEKPADSKAPAKDEKSADTNSDSSNSSQPSIGGTDLESAIDEFNSTDDPKRREELREELEDFFAMFEGETVTVKQ